MIEDNFEIVQMSTSCLSQFGYFIKSGNESAVIDPLRDLTLIEKHLEESKTTLKYIILTHFHADFVAGHYELQKKTGATILIGPTAEKFKLVRFSDSNNICFILSYFIIQSLFQ